MRLQFAIARTPTRFICTIALLCSIWTCWIPDTTALDEFELNALYDLYVTSNYGAVLNAATSQQCLDYNETNTAAWTASPSNESCFWNGIVCNDEGHVVCLALMRTDNASMSTAVWTLPASLGNLTYLQVLSLPALALSGSIPSTIGDCIDLQTLDLNSNGLNATIPDVFDNASMLQAVILHDNQFSGPVPATLAQSASIQYLLLQNNVLTGTLPSQLGNASALMYLDVSNNALNGTIPTSMTELYNLQYVNLAYNHLTGPVPANTTNWNALQILNVSHNALSGAVPADVGIYWLFIQTLDLSFNAFEGEVPATLADLTYLQTLELTQQAGQTLTWPMCTFPLTTLENLTTCGVDHMLINCSAECLETYLNQMSACIFTHYKCACTADAATNCSDSGLWQPAFILSSIESEIQYEDVEFDDLYMAATLSEYVPLDQNQSLALSYASAWFQTWPVVFNATLNVSVTQNAEDVYMWYIYLQCAFTGTLTNAADVIVQIVNHTTIYSFSINEVENTSLVTQCALPYYVSYRSETVDVVLNASVCIGAIADSNECASIAWTTIPIAYSFADLEFAQRMSIQIQLKDIYNDDVTLYTVNTAKFLSNAMPEVTMPTIATADTNLSGATVVIYQASTNNTCITTDNIVSTQIASVNNEVLAIDALIQLDMAGYAPLNHLTSSNTSAESASSYFYAQVQHDSLLAYDLSTSACNQGFSTSFAVVVAVSQNITVYACTDALQCTLAQCI